MHTVGEQLRQWRHRRRLSQLDLAIAADVSARHVSLVETGKSNPSADMILRLAEQLDVPLRERNRLLLAAGFAPRYPERPLDGEALSLGRGREGATRTRALPGAGPRSPMEHRDDQSRHRPVPHRRRPRPAPDPELTALYEELLTPGSEDASHPIESEVAIPMIFRFGGRELRLFSTTTTFGTPMDITLDEVAIELYYPTDAESAAYFTTSGADVRTGL
ncbi:helix-turn-helix domain-containing protein [Microtetraspora malaysiensis]|uniref:helix-turn-helix domain-containing protein n=1 Tax=Microtetraspora malaysiensis TaxID=161358 RepID=UPI003D9386B1